MKKILERYMAEGATVRVLTFAKDDNDRLIGITGKIVEVTNDLHNPAVVIEWKSNKPGLSASTGTVAYNIRYIVTVQKWESRNTTSFNSPTSDSHHPAQWHGPGQSGTPF